ncbi:hypothetical protein HPP92_026039 [Vanilla planifolia]|uniref:SAP domain-containing protein n=1 Tax=Vanilla planifolia TaxID=51239 RepID=A0A835PHT3_VANPL|nr:hypothetical protein HPP92_026312 [Vanilla planifolia]KAG0451781.1 hypothetical protein HPP92_026039 [Vanilla planifolia]
MAIGEALREACNREKEEIASVDSECLDNSDDDPSFDIIEETRSAFSKISFKKPRGRNGNVDAGTESELGMEQIGDGTQKMDKEEGKCFEKVQQLVKGGDFEKLKLDQCKMYLRKHGLRLTGNKSVLIARIREHQEIIDGCGLKKYPPESFVLNCKGDSCVGDVVIFEQNVYEMFSIASRSATGPSCGTRTIAGRIVKESYGVAKQQHTFTIEVLWSEGVKPLPPLYQLLIKGRNLYRIKTMRQRWIDEGERLKVLQEKHARGSHARHSREIRIREKENRKNTMMRKRQVPNGHLTQISKENKQPLEPQNAVQQKKCLNHEKLLQGQDVKSNSSTQQMEGREILKQQQQPLRQMEGREILKQQQQPLQAILKKPNTAEHYISTAAQPRNSCENHYSRTQDPWKSKCENYYPSRTQDPWKSNLNPRGNFVNFHGLQQQQPSILWRPKHYFLHMNQYSLANHSMPIPLQQQYRGYQGETSRNYFGHQGCS